MVEFVATDASKAEQGDRTFLVGVAVEVADGGEFDEYYFNLVEQFCKRYDIELAHNIVKAKTILNRVPSFSVKEADDALVKGLVQNPAIRRIHVCIGWYAERVAVGESDDKISGIQFANSHLMHYYPIVTLWRYHRDHPDWSSVPAEAWIDNVQGRITKSWKYVGNEFDLNLVPHGDITYPSLSTADIVANHLARTLPRSKPFKDLEDSAAGILIDYVDGGHPRITAESVNEEYKDHIVPKHRYSIQGELYFPHPVTFIHDNIFSDFDQGVLPETDFHAYARKWAQENAGSVVSLEPHRLPAIVRSGDRIVYTRGTEPEVCELLRDLNPSKEIEILDSDALLNEVMNEYE